MRRRAAARQSRCEGVLPHSRMFPEMLVVASPIQRRAFALPLPWFGPLQSPSFVPAAFPISQRAQGRSSWPLLQRPPKAWRAHPVSTAVDYDFPVGFGTLPAARSSAMISFRHSMPYSVKAVTSSSPTPRTQRQPSSGSVLIERSCSHASSSLSISATRAMVNTNGIPAIVMRPVDRLDGTPVRRQQLVELGALRLSALRLHRASQGEHARRDRSAAAVERYMFSDAQRRRLIRYSSSQEWQAVDCALTTR
jgi:hypothetical protein